MIKKLAIPSLGIIIFVLGILLLNINSYPVYRFAVFAICIGLLTFFTSSILIFSFYLQKTWIRIGLFVGIFYGSVLAYSSSSAEAKNLQQILLSICTSLSEFFPSRGSYGVAGGPADQFTWEVILFCLLCYFFAISILIAIFGRKLTNKFQLFLSKLNYQKRRIFWCEKYSSKELLLAESIRANTYDAQCIFSVKECCIDDIPTLMENLNYRKHMLCLRKPEQFHPDTLKAPVHFFITDDTRWNIKKAQEVWEKIPAYRNLKKVDFYIRISGGIKNYWADSWAQTIQFQKQENKPEIEIHLLQESELIARKFVKDNPLLTAPGIEIVPQTGKIKGSFKILILGFSDLGAALLRETICDGQFVHIDESDTFSVDIVDILPQKFQLFASRCHEAVDSYNISFYDKDVYSSDFYHFMNDRITSYNRIIISFNDEMLTMDTAAQIVELAKIQDVNLESKLFVNLKNSKPGTKNAQFRELNVFGSLEDCYSQDVIVNENLDKIARQINLNYCMNNGVPDNWASLSLFIRDSNRSSAAGLYNLSRLMGMTDPEKKFDMQTVVNISNNNLLDVYAETEHLRWNAFHFVHGIHKWDISNIQGKITKANDIKAHMRHAALVDFHQLPLIDEKIAPETRNGAIRKSCLQNNDRGIISVLTDIFGKGSVDE